MATYLSMVNEVLMRLREDTVSTVQQTAYSKMIGLYVNDTKRQVEEAWEWDVLNTTLNVTTVANTSTYTVTGSGTRHKGTTANITTTGRQARLRQVSMKWIEDQQQLTTTTPEVPSYWAWNGSDGTDSKVELWPTPNGAYTVAFNMNVPQVDLSDDADVISVPADPVVAGAFARALTERGEDGGLSSGEAYGLYRGILADRIALEQSRTPDFDVWDVT
jgi:hypothetical protein